jgi:hypothetical protein
MTLTWLARPLRLTFQRLPHKGSRFCRQPVTANQNLYALCLTSILRLTQPSPYRPTFHHVWVFQQNYYIRPLYEDENGICLLITPINPRQFHILQADQLPDHLLGVDIDEVQAHYNIQNAYSREVEELVQLDEEAQTPLFASSVS